MVTDNRGRASPKGFERGLNQRGFGLNPPLKPPLNLPPPPLPEHRGGGETKMNPNMFGFHVPPPLNQRGFGLNPPLNQKGGWFNPPRNQRGFGLNPPLNHRGVGLNPALNQRFFFFLRPEN